MSAVISALSSLVSKPLKPTIAELIFLCREIAISLHKNTDLRIVCVRCRNTAKYGNATYFIAAVLSTHETETTKTRSTICKTESQAVEDLFKRLSEEVGKKMMQQKQLQLSDGWQLTPVESGPVDRVTVNGTDTAQAGSQAAQAGVDAAGSASTGAAGTGGLSAGVAGDATAALTSGGAAQAGVAGADGQVRGADGRVQARAGQ